MVPHKLTERIPDHLVQQWRDNSVFWNRLVIGGISALWIPLGIAIAWLPFRNGSGSVQLAIVCATTIAFLLLWYLLIRWRGRCTFNARSQTKLPLVEIAGDRITVRWHGETIESTVDTCNFRRGRAWQMKYASRKAGGLPFGDRELILIDLPPLHRCDVPNKAGNRIGEAERSEMDKLSSPPDYGRRSTADYCWIARV